jgi:tetratricopeptide (TPR) repeat protein
VKELTGVPAAGQSPAAAMNLRGLAELLAGNLQEALAAFDKAVALDPAASGVHLNRGITLLKLDRLAEASAELEKLYADEESIYRARAAYHNALAKDRVGRIDLAATWLTNATELDPTYSDAWFYLGVIRERQGDMQAAGKAYRKVLEKYPDSVSALVRFGVSAQRAGHPDTARNYLNRVLRLAPGSDEAIEARKFLVMWE